MKLFRVRKITNMVTTRNFEAVPDNFNVIWICVADIVHRNGWLHCTIIKSQTSLTFASEIEVFEGIDFL
jgi:hypothetical protein